MHWQLDVTFKEDANTTLDKQAAENLNIIRKWCLSILKMVEIFPSQSVHEKETICNQYEPSRVFGTGIKFLKTRYFEKEEGKQFMRMSCLFDGIPSIFPKKVRQYSLMDTLVYRPLCRCV